MEQDIFFEPINPPDKLPIQLLPVLEKKVYLPAKHWHSYIEILYVSKGKNDIWEEGKNSISDTSSPSNRLYIINSNVIHKVVASSDNLGYVLQIDYEFIKKLFPDISAYHFRQFDDDQTALKFTDILLDTANHYLRNDTYDWISVCGNVYQLLYLLFENLLVHDAPSKNIASAKHQQRLKELLTYIEQEYENPITIDSIAEHFHLSQGYLTKFFNQNMHMTIKEFVTRTRLEHAVHDLVHTDLTVLDIALKNGFPSSKSFISSFRKYYDTTPALYRNILYKQ